MRRSLIAFSTLLAASGAALAADVVGFEPAAPVSEPAPARSVLLGGGVGFAPAYEGSDEYRVFGFPIVSYNSGREGPRRFEFRALDDIRLHALRFGGLSFGPLAGYSFGREEDASDRLAGLGDVDGGLVLGGFASFDTEVATGVTLGADIAVSSQVTGDAFDERSFLGLPVPVRDRVEENYGYGYTVDFGASAEFDLSPRLNLATRVGAEYASEEYMRTFFGVNGSQALAAFERGNSISTFGTPGGPFTPLAAGVGVPDDQLFANQIGGQIKNVYINANAAFDVTDSFQVRAGLGYSRLIGDAADSPISVSDNQFTGSLGAAYRFRF